MKKTILMTIIGLLAFAALAAAQPKASEEPDFSIYPCFADGELAYPNGSETGRGVFVRVTNIDTGEVFETVTGEGFPPIPDFDNNYKSVFGCIPGEHSVHVFATDGTVQSESKMLVPTDMQVFMDLVLDQEAKKNGVIHSIITDIKIKLKDIFSVFS